jgi:hypothetical protein
VYPLHVESGKRYLVDAASQPFLVHGDCAWGLLTKLTREEAEQYLEDRRLKGFNTILVMLTSRHILIGPSSNVYGDAPFTTAGDFSTPNERYFAHVDWVLRKAAEKGILVLLAPAYTGYQGSSDEGWYPTMQANGTAKLRAYGQYLGTRYRSFNNILWVNGGDFSPPDNAGKDLVRAVANGIRDVIPQSLHTFHGGRHTTALGYWGTAEPWLTVNNIYTDEYTVVSAAYQEYARAQMPFFLIEERYENEGASEALVRTQAYQAVLSGATGQVMGNRPMWGFMSGWQTALNSPGARTLQHLRNLFEARPWWTLQPDTNGLLLTAGISSGADRAVAARAADRSFAVAYMPSVRTVTVNLTQLVGPKVNAKWCDPANGTCSTAPGSPFQATGSQSFRPAAPNSSNFGDWTLVLESGQ